MHWLTLPLQSKVSSNSLVFIMEQMYDQDTRWPGAFDHSAFLGSLMAASGMSIRTSARKPTELSFDRCSTSQTGYKLTSHAQADTSAPVSLLLWATCFLEHTHRAAVRYKRLDIKRHIQIKQSHSLGVNFFCSREAKAQITCLSVTEISISPGRVTACGFYWDLTLFIH